MKECPVCNSKTFDDSEVCYGCLYVYEEEEFELEEPSLCPSDILLGEALNQKGLVISLDICIDAGRIFEEVSYEDYYRAPGVSVRDGDGVCRPSAVIIASPILPNFS